MPLKSRATSCLAVVLLAAMGCGSDTAAPLVITHVTVIDATGNPAAPDMTVVIRDAHIAEIDSSDRVSVPKNAHVIDGTGKFLIPGLWDMHGHLTDATEGALPLLIEHGVTGVRDMGGDLAQVDHWRKEIADGTRLGPHIVRAGPIIDGPSEAKHHLSVNNPAQAVHTVDSLKQVGVDFIKTHTMLPRESFFALMEEARKQNIPVAVHLPRTVTVAEASDAGARSLEHIEMMIASAAYQVGPTAQRVADVLPAITGDAGAKIFATFVKNGTWYVPTLVAYERGFVLWGSDPAKVAIRSKTQGHQMELVRAMHEAGVQIMTGSDFSDWALVPGIDLHNELALLVEAGFTPMEALQAATVKPATFLGMQDSLGTIEVGKIADLVLLDADPLEDISHTRKIRAVVVGGRLVPVSDLRSRFTDAQQTR